MKTRDIIRAIFGSTLILSALSAQTVLWEEEFAATDGWSTAPLMDAGQPNANWSFTGNGSAEVVAANPTGSLNFTSGFTGPTDQLNALFLGEAVNPSLIYTAALTFSNSDFNGSTPDKRGNIELRFQWEAGQTIGAVNITQRNGVNASTVQFSAGDGTFNGGSGAVTLSEALSGAADYLLKIDFAPATSTVSFSITNIASSALVASDSGTLIGTQTNLRGVSAFGSGFLATDSSTFSTSQWSVTSIPIPKTYSRIVTAEMRANAVENVENEAWAAERVRLLRNRLEGYLNASTETLWALLPSQDFPRSSLIAPGGSLPAPYQEAHESVRPSVSNGFGRSFRFHIDPLNHPWKVYSRGLERWLPDNDLGAYYESGLNQQGAFRVELADQTLLVAQANSPSDAWIDDGTGAAINGMKVFVAAHYAYRVWSELIDVVRDLAELYTLTNDPLPAHQAGILLDRMADLYPAMNFAPHFALGMEISSGGTGKGRVQGAIWETWTAQRLSIAYDLVFDALIEDVALVEFSSEKSELFSLGDKSDPSAIATHIKENLLKEFIIGIRDERIVGNDGMHQYAMAAAAIALDNPIETPPALDWIFEPDGGQLPRILIDGLNRDGYGIEAGLGYARIPTASVFELANLFQRYPDYPISDLFSQFPKLRNSLSSGERVRVAEGSILHWGDGGRALAVGSIGYPVEIEMALRGYEIRPDDTSLREVLNAVGRNPQRIPGDIYSATPNALRDRVLDHLAGKGADLWAPKSFNSGGLGFAVLQAPASEFSRTFALNYGTMGHGHGHGDRLGLHVIYNELYHATDLGYPSFATVNPERIGWTSHTASHNTVMVDDQRMEIWSNHSGKTKLFAEAGPVRVADIIGEGPETWKGQGHSKRSATPNPIYPQVETYRRALVMVDVDERNSYAVDLFWVRGGSKHRLMQNGGGRAFSSSWNYWIPQDEGTLAGPNVPPGQFYDGPANWDYRGSGLMYLKNVSHAAPDQPFWAEWTIFNQTGRTHPNTRFRVHNLTELDTISIATGPTPEGGPGDLAYLSRLRTGPDLESQFISVLEPYEDCPFLTQVESLASREVNGRFQATLKIGLTNGKTDILFVNEEYTEVTLGDFTMKGRLAWIRFGIDDEPEEVSLIDAEFIHWKDREFRAQAPSYRGQIVGLDESDLDHVLVMVEPPLLTSPVGKTMVVQNDARADASYRVQEWPESNTLDIGPAALGEVHRNPKNYTEGIVRNIDIGQWLHIPNTDYFDLENESL